MANQQDEQVTEKIRRAFTEHGGAFFDQDEVQRIRSMISRPSKGDIKRGRLKKLTFVGIAVCAMTFGAFAPTWLKSDDTRDVTIYSPPVAWDIRRDKNTIVYNTSTWILERCKLESAVTVRLFDAKGNRLKPDIPLRAIETGDIIRPIENPKVRLSNEYPVLVDTRDYVYSVNPKVVDRASEFLVKHRCITDDGISVYASYGPLPFPQEPDGRLLWEDEPEKRIWRRAAD